MFCNKCGKQVRDDATFCPGCGNRMSQGAPSASVPTGSPQPSSGGVSSVNVGEVLKKQEGSWWHKGAPIRVTEKTLRRGDGCVTLTLIVENLAPKTINALFFAVKGDNVLKEERFSDEAAFLDISIGACGSMTLAPYIISDDTVRVVRLKLTAIAYDDDSVWRNDRDVYLEDAPVQREFISSDYSDGLLLASKEREGEGAEHSKYVFYSGEGDGWWLCGCGAFSIYDRCPKCGLGREKSLRIFTKEHLESLQREADAEKARRAAEAEAARQAEEAERARRRAEEEKARREAEAARLASAKYCPSCGAQLDGDEMFCGNCGAKVS